MNIVSSRFSLFLFFANFFRDPDCIGQVMRVCPGRFCAFVEPPCPMLREFAICRDGMLKSRSESIYLPQRLIKHLIAPQKSQKDTKGTHYGFLCPFVTFVVQLYA